MGSSRRHQVVFATLRVAASSALSPRRHDSDLADAQWRLIELLLPPPATAGRPEKHPRHEIVNAIPYVARTGLADRQPLDPRVASDRREIRR
jgi:Putative transposase of IS4/5 family (DUF4096)